MTAGAQWLETYIICQVLLAGALVWVRLTRGGRSPHRTLWLARMVFLGVVFTPVLVRFVDPPRLTLFPAVVSLDEMPRLDLSPVLMTPRSSFASSGVPERAASRAIDPLLLSWIVVLLGGLIHLSRTSRDLVRIRRILRTAVVLRSTGNVRVVVSGECFPLRS